MCGWRTAIAAALDSEMASAPPSFESSAVRQVLAPVKRAGSFGAPGRSAAAKQVVGGPILPLDCGKARKRRPAARPLAS
jgi:hypothetical protein